MAVPSPQAALKRAVKGLTYESESDEPFEVLVWPQKQVGDDLSEARIAELHGAGTDSPVEHLSLERFFAPLLEHQEWHRKQEAAVVERYQKLLDTIKAHLQDTRVYQVGSIEKGIYIVGKSTTGDWLGIKTSAVES
jgi:hypothetical protein